MTQCAPVANLKSWPHAHLPPAPTGTPKITELGSGRRGRASWARRDCGLPGVNRRCRPQPPPATRPAFGEEPGAPRARGEQRAPSARLPPPSPPEPWERRVAPGGGRLDPAGLGAKVVGVPALTSSEEPRLLRAEPASRGQPGGRAGLPAECPHSKRASCTAPRPREGRGWRDGAARLHGPVRSCGLSRAGSSQTCLSRKGGEEAPRPLDPAAASPPGSGGWSGCPPSLPPAWLEPGPCRLSWGLGRPTQRSGCPTSLSAPHSGPGQLAFRGQAQLGETSGVRGVQSLIPGEKRVAAREAQVRHGRTSHLVPSPAMEK